MPAFAIYDLTGAEAGSRFEGITGDTVATTRVGRVADLSGNGLDVAGSMLSDLLPIADILARGRRQTRGSTHRPLIFLAMYTCACGCSRLAQAALSPSDIDDAETYLSEKWG
ncbi:hypothetical protein [uncultured Gilvimarinus sp.]|uniref:hypothetical protein n=1 Tax=uncultured Gilvimarinus sp. TaxID=1689143 RepID=UPI0030DDC3C8